MLPGLSTQNRTYIHYNLNILTASMQLDDSNISVAQFELVVPMYEFGVASLVLRAEPHYACFLDAVDRRSRRVALSL
jgi:hypothetical protein